MYIRKERKRLESVEWVAAFNSFWSIYRDVSFNTIGPLRPLNTLKQTI